jgi:hypothetical protein
MSHSPRARSSSAMSVGGHNAEVASIVARVAFDRFPDHIGPWSTSAHDPKGDFLDLRVQLLRATVTIQRATTSASDEFKALVSALPA